MGKDSGGGTQKTTSEPWSGVRPYLTGTAAQSSTTLRPGAVPISYNTTGGGGDNGNEMRTPVYAASDYITTNTPGSQGLYGQAQDLYNQSGWSGQQQSTLDQWLAELQSPHRAAQNNQMVYNASDIANGKYQSNFGPVANINGSNVDAVSARAGQGSLDPTAALQQLLTGQVNNPYLNEQIAALGNDLSTNLNQNIMPGLRSGAAVAGGFGGSRQGIAEGLAANGVTSTLGNQAAGLRGTAFENAQNRMYQTATGLNQQAVDIATGNANRDQTTQQFNANLGLQNNQFGLTQNQSNVQNLLAGNQALGAANASKDANWNQILSLLGTPGQENWQNFNNYANVITSGAGLGGTQSASAPGGKSFIAGAAGGGLAGAGLASALSMSTPWGAGIGAGLGLLGAL